MTQQNDSRALMENALRKIQRLNSDIKELENRQHEPIAIVGIGCRYPGADDGVEQFWSNLCAGVNSVSPLTDQRWNQARYFDPQSPVPGKTYSPNAGLLDDVLRFDAELFGITPREAECMDPQQRLLLEVTWQALENASMAPDKVRGSNAGVFTGIMNKDHSDLLVRHLNLDEIAAHMNAGNHESVHSGRVSYTFDFKGPCVTLNTACSSSLVTVHLACQSLRQNECDFALAGGCNVMLAPTTSIAQSQAMMHSPEGLCKAFDASANGYVRAEGCGVLVLKRLSRAVADGDHIYALIRGSAVNQDGLSQGIMAPNGPSQVRVIRSALDNARVNAKDVSYVEAHGTGTKLGDPIELQTLGAVYGRATGRAAPLLVGSVKTNIGHCESAAGVAGIIKVAKALQHGKIPAQLHFDTPNPFVDLNVENIEICTDPRAWPAFSTPAPAAGVPASRLAAVSSFGFSGTNAHIILESYTPATHREPGVEHPQQLLFISAREQSALKAYIPRLIDFLESSDEQALADICFSQNTGRRQFEQRIAVSGKSRRDLIQALHQSLTAERLVTRHDPRGPQIGFVMGKLDPQSRARLRPLLEASLLFQKASTEYLDTATQTLGRDVSAALWNAAANEQDQDLIDGALLYGFAMMWRALGVLPRWIIAYGPAHPVAAALVGALSLEQTILAIAGLGAQDKALAYLYRNKSDRHQPLQLNMDPEGLDQALQADAVNVIIAMGDASFIDGYLTRHVNITSVQIPAKSGADVWADIGATLVTLYEAGTPLIAAAWDNRPQRKKMPLPTYAFQGRRYWLERLNALNDEQSNANVQPVANLVLADPSSMSAREYVKYLIRQLAKLEDYSLSDESLLIDDVGFDSLMLAELRTRVEKAYPTLGKIPLDLLHTGQLGELLDFVHTAVGKTQPSLATPDALSGRDFAMAWLTQWNASGNVDNVGRMNKRHVHKSSERNVLLGAIAAIEDTGWYAAELFHDQTHPFFYEHAQDHIPGLYLIEAVRQFGIACTHLFQGVPHDFPFVLDDMHIQFDSFAEHDSPVFLIAEYIDLMFKDGHLHRSHSRCHIVQNGRALGTVEGRGLILQPADYQTARSLEATI
ncbi:beta-ketoacyl synthase family protein,A-factor biosynthesis repeat protein [Pseudomonas sp. GM79]|uniref:beta-ketoacyl synthase N-terminal-like domain-containing protein n=1 Tax=unclassified Pseudomonas TaxID=196821 RepID=UPI00026F84FC|nr:beta-ketoacyl synthase N-terminal-like domain-containing protein [Pseudomonas sp. GM79]EJN22261.1 beta-ketoacyl synthase family protein,A-factor biosynthesis repeat protein [Pseudomonas sp. GM79]